MHIDPSERRWTYLVGGMLFAGVAILMYTALALNLHPPSNVETVNSARLHLTEEFAEKNLGVKTMPDGSIAVTMVAARYAFYPREIEVPVDTPVTFRIASFDVLHGVHVPFTNLATMIVPGYVSQVNTQFPRTGEFQLLCNEYCGLGHDYMWSRLKVIPKKAT